MRKTKFYALVLAAAMAVAGFAGCTDDENENNGEGTKEPTENVDTKEKRVMTIRGEYYDEHGKMWDSYTLGFRYDAQGRVDTIITNGTRKEVLTYEENRVTGTSEGFVRECTFENGLVVKERCEGIEGRRTSEYSYADGRLSSMKITGLLNQTENDVMTMEVMTDGSGNWVGVNSTYPVESEDHADAQNIYTITMSNVENNLNLDLMGLFFGGENEISLLLGFAGERSPKLIAEMLSKETLESSEEVYTDLYTFSYQVDEDGYLREIRGELREEGELSDVTIYKIGYEEGDVSIVIPGEDEEGNEDDENPGGNVEEPEIKKRKIVKADMMERIEYDNEGRVARIVLDEEEAFNVVWGEDEVVLDYGNGEKVTFEMEEGRAVKAAHTDSQDPGFEDVYEYEYENGRISRIVNRYKYEGKSNVESMVYEYEGENWVGFTYYTADGQENGKVVVEPSNVKNNMNLDLYCYISDTYTNYYDRFLGLVGKRCPYLPANIMEWDADGNIILDYTYEYTVNEEGYVLDMTEGDETYFFEYE